MRKAYSDIPAIKWEAPRAFNKRWIYYDEAQCSLGADMMQALRWSVDDFNGLLMNPQRGDRANVIYAVAIMAWVQDAVYKFQGTLRKELIREFCWESEQSVKEARDYCRALRSFALAHPLGTTKQTKYPALKDLVCIDIRHKDDLAASITDVGRWYWDYNIIRELRPTDSIDAYLLTYTPDDSYQFLQYIAISYCDIRKAICVYLEKMQALGRFISKCRRKEYVVSKNTPL